jgi:hypothetical protein
MICTVCGTENTETATVCSSCKAFLQNRVPTLDLFKTAWGVLVAPGRTFKEVAIAEHKNYALSLFGLFGITAVTGTVATLKVGDIVGGLIETAAVSTAAGFVVGILLSPIVAIVHAAVSGLVRGDVSYRRSLGITAYALVPGIAVGLLVFPIQLLTFGEHFFIANPHPATINAASYWAMTALQGLSLVWTLFLLAAGSKVGLRVNTVKAVYVTVFTAATVVGGWVWAARYLVSLAVSHGAL